MATHMQLTLLEALNTLKIADHHDHVHYRGTIFELLRGKKRIRHDEADRLAKFFPETDTGYWLGVQDDSDTRAKFPDSFPE